MSARSSWPILAALGVLAVVGLSVATRGTPEGGAGATWAAADPGLESRSVAVPRPPAAGQDDAAGSSVVVEVDPASGALVRADNRAHAGRRTPCSVGPVPAGIRCPDGGCLPLLNGVDAAPPLLRSADRGPLTPVVAVVVDRDGWDWYEHADGAMTTCRPQWITGVRGQRELRVVTLHNAPDPQMRDEALAPDSHPHARSK